MLELLTLIISSIIIIFYDYNKWITTKDLYERFQVKEENEIKKREFFKEIIKDFESRKDTAYGWFRSELIESKEFFKYFFGTYVSLGSFFLFIISESYFDDTNLLLISSIFLMYFIAWVITVVIFSRDRKKCFFGAGTYLFRLPLVFIVVLLFLSIFSGVIIDEPLTLDISIENSWYLSISGISFSIAVGLFIVITLAPLLEKERRTKKDIHYEFINLITKHKDILLPSEFYEVEEFQTLYEKYEESSIPSRSLLSLTYSLIGFLAIGLASIYIALIGRIPSSPAEGSTSFEGLILGVFGFLIFFIVIIIWSIVQNILLKSLEEDE